MRRARRIAGARDGHAHKLRPIVVAFVEAQRTLVKEGRVDVTLYLHLRLHV